MSMQIPIFEQVGEAVRSMTPDDLGTVRYRFHGRGVKVWFDAEKAGREHYEAQFLARRHVDGLDGTVLEIGFHAEHRDEADNVAVIDRIGKAKGWRRALGGDAEAGVFFGADGWRRVSEVWLDADLDDPDLAFEVAARLVDYLAAIEPARRS